MTPKDRRILVITVLGVVVAGVLLALLWLGLGRAGLGLDFIGDRLLRILSSRRIILLGMLAAIALIVGAWFLVKRMALRIAVIAVGLCAIAVVVGWHTLAKKFPHQAILSPARWGEAWPILLGTDIPLAEYQPRSLLVVDRKSVPRAAYPAIDIHFHLESLPPNITPERLVRAMDAAGVAKVVNLGGLPGMYEHFAQTFQAKYPDRFVMFVKPDVAALARPNGTAELVLWIDAAARAGAQGVKISKSLGLGHRDASGKLVRVDDARLDPVWAEAGRLGMPVLIHVGDPDAFFQPADAHNERYEEVNATGLSYQQRPEYPTKEEIMAERERVIARHPTTNFIGAHMGMQDDNLGAAAALLDRYPNYYVDMSSVVHSLGRQPNTARRFFIKYQDRILFGTDGGYALEAEGKGWTPERYFSSYFEFLETDNDYMEYPLWGINNQGRWHVYGLNLPPEVLEKVYARNAERLLPSHADVTARLAGRFPMLDEGKRIPTAAPPTPTAATRAR